MRPSSRPVELGEASESQVYRRWRRGTSVAVLSQQHGLSGSIIDRMINKMRAQGILERTLEYIYDPSFKARDAASTILGPMPEGPRATASLKPPAGLSPYLASLYVDAPLLSREQEAHLFRKMNYLKFLACKLREKLDPARARGAHLDEIERLQAEALEVKNQLIGANLRLVVSIVKKRVGPSNNFFELVSDGNMSLIRAVEKFDFLRGFKFSTYATWAIIRNFARMIPEEKRWRHRVITGYEEIFESATDRCSEEHEYESDHRHNQEAVQRMLGRLTDRERRIIVSRYGIGGANELTLEQLGKELGITKERVRQIESQARGKLRGFARNGMKS
jgi:RNA polymerase primary sigma factor